MADPTVTASKTPQAESSTEGPPASLRNVKATPGPARIILASDELDLGTMSETEKRTGRFYFANGGGEPLIIEDVKATCGCTVPNLPKRTFEPGETGHIEIEFDPTAPGAQHKLVNLITNASPKKIAQFRVQADVQTFISFRPRMVQLGTLEYGREHRDQVIVASPVTDPVIRRIATSNPVVQARRVDDRSPSEGTTIEIVIPADAPWGPLFSWLIVTMEGRTSPDAAPITHTSRIRIQGELFGSLRAEPNTFRFGAAPGASFERTMVVRRSDGAPFELRGATVECNMLAGVDAHISPRGTGAYELTLAATASEQPGQVRGAVVVETDVPGEERIEIPIVGVVRDGG